MSPVTGHRHRLYYMGDCESWEKKNGKYGSEYLSHDVGAMHLMFHSSGLFVYPVVPEKMQKTRNNLKINETIDKDRPNVCSASKVDSDTREEFDTH
jgi:hypothetical protein